jgi:hypothetical protein
MRDAQLFMTLCVDSTHYLISEMRCGNFRKVTEGASQSVPPTLNLRLTQFTMVCAKSMIPPEASFFQTKENAHAQNGKAFQNASICPNARF